jgi:hypothetical protein
VGIVGNNSREIIGDDLLGHYGIYVVSKQLKGEFRITAIIGERIIIDKIQSGEGQGPSNIWDNRETVEIKGKVKIEIENTLEPLSEVCYVVDSFPRNLDIILGQDWL